MTAKEIILLQVESSELVAVSRDLFREYEQAIGMNLEYQDFLPSWRHFLRRICRPPELCCSRWPKTVLLAALPCALLMVK